MRTLYSVWCACLISVTLGSSRIVDSEVKDYAKLFKQTLDAHLEDKLALSKIRDMIRNHEKELGIRRLNGTLEFERIFLNIQLRFTDLQQSVSRLKSTIETNLSGPSISSPPVPGSPPIIGRGNRRPGDVSNAPPMIPPSGPPLPANGGPHPRPVVPLRRCCVDQGPLVYSGRFREKVELEECYENIDEQLNAIKRAGVVNTMKANLASTSGLKWQYFASTTRHYIQYPTSNRACDKQSPALNSPLTEEWFVEKLRMERKNLVILMDNGRATRTPVSPDSPMTHRDLMAEAVQKTLRTLTSDDKVNVVLFPYGSNTTDVFPGCSENLLVATQSNTDLLVQYVKGASTSDSEPNLMNGLTKVYSLLEKQELESEASFERRSNLVIILLDGSSSPTDVSGIPLYEMMARYQRTLGNSIQHFVYSLGEPISDDVTLRMAQIADQNNMKITVKNGTPVTKWPAIPGLVTNGQPVGKEGVFRVIKDVLAFPGGVSTYFQLLPPRIDTSNQVTTLTPILDNRLGVKMTLASLVYNNSDVLGVAAVDASIGSVFTEIANFDVGQDSYMYLMDLKIGQVLMHPKLRDPDQTIYEDTVFPRLDLIEPDLTITQRILILNASTSMDHFNSSQLKRVRMTVSGEVSKADVGAPIPATVYFRRLGGTHLCVVLVQFSSDDEEARLLITNANQTARLHAPYHRIDKTVMAPFSNKPDQDTVCHLYDNFVSFKESVIKLSPVVFSEPEQYKYNVESLNDISQINAFLINGGKTTLIREDAKDLILQTVRATNGLDTLWKSTAKQVIDRFYGSTSGVFRLFPGLPLQNGFDHLKSDWYQRSIANPNTTFYHYGKLTDVTRNNVIIVSQAVMEQGRIQGVTGLTVTLRYFASQLLNTVAGCSGQSLKCHILDSSGYVLVDTSPAPTQKRHLAERYPWMMKDMVSRHAIEFEWCTGFSDGYHKLLYTLVNKVTSDLANPDPCRQYRLEPVTDTNLFLLLLTDPGQHSCLNDTMPCTGCGVSSFSPRYHFSLSQCETCQYNSTHCQCPCYCTADYDMCQGQFQPQGDGSFPISSCFNRPFVDDQSDLQPDSPGPMFEHCPIPCAAIEELTTCHNLTHCKPSSEVYPTCIWKDEEELRNVTESKFFPTTPIRTPPPLPTMSYSGAVAVSTKPITTSSPPPIKSTIITTTTITTKPSREPPGKPSTPSSISTASVAPSGELMSISPIPPSTSISSAFFNVSGSSSRSGIPASSTMSFKISSVMMKTPPSVSLLVSTKHGPIPYTDKQELSTRNKVTPPTNQQDVSTRNKVTPPTNQQDVSTRNKVTPPTMSTIVSTPSKQTLLTLMTSTLPGHTEEPTHTITSSNVPTRNIPGPTDTISTERLTYSDEQEDNGLEGGQIAAIVIGVLAVIVIVLVILTKLYGKKFRRPGAADSSKYLAGSGVFNSTFFNRSTEEVTLSRGPRTTAGYEEMTN